MTKQLNLTVLQWYEMLPVKLRDKAQAYAMENGGCINKKVESLKDALFDGFTWQETEEGGEYWCKVKNINAPRYQSAYIKKHNL